MAEQNFADRTDFEMAFTLLIGVEGVYSSDPNDSGNWTGGKCGSGQCKGTKYGVSAAAYPSLDIINLTLEDAHTIYFRDYWQPAHCPQQSPRLAYIMFDSAVNNGVSRAMRFLQTAIGSTSDGVWGPNTQSALSRALAADPADINLAIEVHAQRLYFMAGLSTWLTYGLGWSRRLTRVSMQASLYWPRPIALLAAAEDGV